MLLCRKSSKRVRDLWWLGLPPGIRGQVWKRAIGNDLNISPGEGVGEKGREILILKMNLVVYCLVITHDIICFRFRIISDFT